LTASSSSLTRTVNLRSVFIESASTNLGAEVSFYISVYTLPTDLFVVPRQITLKVGRLGLSVCAAQKYRQAFVGSFLPFEDGHVSRKRDRGIE
jgi:hypothetical protein